MAFAKNQHHNNGHNLLGAKLNQNGKHEIGKAGNASVTAEVIGEIQLAQAVEIYYGYCFDAGLDEYCYWYPAVDVIVTDTWVEYTPL